MLVKRIQISILGECEGGCQAELWENRSFVQFYVWNETEILS